MGQFSIFGAHEEKRATDFHGSARIRISQESSRSSTDSRTFSSTVEQEQKFAKVGSRVVHRACTGNAERQGSGVRGQGSGVRGQGSGVRGQGSVWLEVVS